MDCSEARLLIRNNMTAGAGPGRVPQLGFHLAGCPQCRERYAVRQARRSGAASWRIIPALRRTPNESTATPRKRRVLRVGIIAVLGLGLILTWLIGLPLARAVSDVLVMTSLHGSQSEHNSVGHLSSPPAALLVSTPQSPAPTFVPASTATVPPRPSTTPTSFATATNVSLAVRKTAVPTQLVQTDQPDRQSSRDRPSATMIAIAPIDTVATASEATPTASVPTATTLATQLTSTRATRKEPQREPDVASTTILFLGLDAREGEGFVARSDAILVAHFDPERNRLAMLSLPRDLWVNIPGAGQGKVNSAFIIGEQVGEGASLAKETVGAAIGVPIDYVVVMDFTGFRSLVDALDGITVNVPTELYDPNFPTEDYGYRVAHFLPGVQLMDGEQALTYSRIRHPDSDFQRMRRQETVVLAIARKLRERGMFRNLREADQITSALKPYMRTDMSPSVALNLLFHMRSVDLASAKYIAADGTMLIETNIGGAYAVYADESVLHELGAQLIDGE